jgi:hypothetical protein
MTHKYKNLSAGWSSVSGTGLDSDEDNKEARDRAFILVDTSLGVSLEDKNWQLPEARSTTKRHLARVEDLVNGLLD